MTDKNNFKILYKLASSIMNLKEDELRSKSRKNHIAVTRQVVAVIGRTEEDIHRTIIAEQLGRDRTSINYYEHSHKSNYATYPLYRKTFNKIYRAYKDLETTKNVFVDQADLKSYLFKNGVVESEKQDMKLKIKSGKVSCIIKTSYFDFSKQMEIIKLALENYHHSIAIK